jgi:hypothetical protein
MWMKPWSLIATFVGIEKNSILAPLLPIEPLKSKGSPIACKIINQTKEKQIDTPS